MSNTESDDTRTRIARAALSTFAEFGFDGARTREIARRAGVNQGLITYYFKSKEALWREAANAAFEELSDVLADTTQQSEGLPEKAAQQLWIRQFALFLAERPTLLRFMIGEGKRPDERLDWLVHTHLKGFYQSAAPFSQDPERRAHEFYAFIGAAAVMFAVADECVRVTGIDPTTRHSMELHAELLAELFAGNRPAT